MKLKRKGERYSIRSQGKQGREMQVSSAAMQSEKSKARDKNLFWRSAMDLPVLRPLTGGWS